MSDQAPERAGRGERGELGGREGEESHSQVGSKNVGRKGRSRAEWVSLAVSGLLLASLLGLIGYEHFSRGSAPPLIQVRPQLDAVREDPDGQGRTRGQGVTYYVPVEVKNLGDQTAEDVVVELVLQPPQGEPERAEVTIHLLAGGATQATTAIFRSDPRRGTLTATARSYLEP